VQSTPASIVTEVGRLRENVRGHITVAVEAVDLVSITYYTGTHTETAVLAGEHWDTYAKAVGDTDRAVKRNRLRAVQPVPVAVEAAS
jgi:predicted transcriptional regulator